MFETFAVQASTVLASKNAANDGGSGEGVRNLLRRVTPD
ncbi:hypothetical protein HNR46_003980 [Haloferula luteola]|uniref:Uncharacterized protein n=1 Tax=Haloferula luteola TaxID=595692 RepID=A0A840VIV4_9BACT|nr:hypothetical protein [Haloferula luteola]